MDSAAWRIEALENECARLRVALAEAEAARDRLWQSYVTTLLERRAEGNG